MSTETAWFAAWFDTPYYHILYQNRNEEEAQSFVTRLVNHLGIEPDQQVLDLACGKGRHAIYLHSLGLNVVGLDLSENSIQYAKQFENERLHFAVHDMRDLYQPECFDVVFNLFTSFGYFDDAAENERVLASIYAMLKPGGRLVLDFLHLEKVLKTLVATEVKTLSGIDFHIEKRFDGKHIYKDIRFEDQGKAFHFTERVQGLSPADFYRMLEQAGFKVLTTFGDLHLSPLQADSDRFIVVAEKQI